MGGQGRGLDCKPGAGGTLAAAGKPAASALKGLSLPAVRHSRVARWGIWQSRGTWGQQAAAAVWASPCLPSPRAQRPHPQSTRPTPGRECSCAAGAQASCARGAPVLQRRLLPLPPADLQLQWAGPPQRRHCRPTLVLLAVSLLLQPPSAQRLLLQVQPQLRCRAAAGGPARHRTTCPPPHARLLGPRQLLLLPLPPPPPLRCRAELPEPAEAAAALPMPPLPPACLPQGRERRWLRRAAGRCWQPVEAVRVAGAYRAPECPYASARGSLQGRASGGSGGGCRAPRLDVPYAAIEGPLQTIRRIPGPPRACLLPVQQHVLCVLLLLVTAAEATLLLADRSHKSRDRNWVDSGCHTEPSGDKRRLQLSLVPTGPPWCWPSWLARRWPRPWA